MSLGNLNKRILITALPVLLIGFGITGGCLIVRGACFEVPIWRLYSGGGNMALSFTEFEIEDNNKTAIIPCGVFAFNLPLDLVELFTADNQILKGYHCISETEKITEEITGINGMMSSILGTSWDNPENYLEHSPFLITQRYEDEGKAKSLTEHKANR